MIIEEGEIFILTTGQYSDYTLLAPCRANQDIDIESLGTEYAQLRRKQGKSWWGSIYGFVKWIVVDKKLADELPFREWNIEFGPDGAYSSLEEPDTFWRD